LFELLLGAELLVATPDGPEEEEIRVTGEELAFLFLEPGVLPVFTDIERLQDCQPAGCGYAAMAGETLFEIAADNDIARIVVNPVSPAPVPIERPDIEALGRGRLPVSGGEELIPEGTVLKVGRPAQPLPDDVAEAIRAALASEKRVVAAWLFLIKQQPNPPEHAIAIAFDEGVDAAARAAAIRAVVQDAGDRSVGARVVTFFPAGTASDQTGELFFEREPSV
jgi:hypothetical protein